MNISVYEKQVIEKWIHVDGFDFNLGHLLCCIEEILETKENDTSGDYSLRDYQLRYPKEMDKLVKMGYVNNYTGSRMANLYCAKDTKTLEELRDCIYDTDA